MELGDNSIL